MNAWKCEETYHGWIVYAVDDTGEPLPGPVVADCGGSEAHARRITKLPKLEAIVAKLPKCWRLDESGKPVQDVPVVPGIRVWRNEWQTTLGEKVLEVDSTNRVRLDDMPYMYNGNVLANTPEAAKAARKEAGS